MKNTKDRLKLQKQQNNSSKILKPPAIFRPLSVKTINLPDIFDENKPKLHTKNGRLDVKKPLRSTKSCSNATELSITDLTLKFQYKNDMIRRDFFNHNSKSSNFKQFSQNSRHYHFNKFRPLPPIYK